jgi:CDP-glycerol glycerophosphotransferase (TagB/SpsB family)
MTENQEFVNSVFHADLVINLASTITIDAALCDRPVISVAYDPDPDGPYQKWIDRYHTEYEHYQTALQCGAVRLARSHEELMTLIETYLQHPELDREGRRKLVNLWCGNNDGRSAARLAATLLQVTAGKKGEFERESLAESRRAS